MEQNKKALCSFSFALFLFAIFVVSVKPVQGQNIMLPDEKPSLSVVGEAKRKSLQTRQKYQLQLKMPLVMQIPRAKLMQKKWIK